MYKVLLISIFFLILIFACDDDITDPKNNAPVIYSLASFPNEVQFSDSFIVFCDAHDIDGDSLFYDWSCTSGASIKGASKSIPFQLSNTKENNRIFYAPDSLTVQQDSIRVFCDVRDGKGGAKTDWVFIKLRNN